MKIGFMRIGLLFEKNLLKVRYFATLKTEEKWKEPGNNFAIL